MLVLSLIFGEQQPHTSCQINRVLIGEQTLFWWWENRMSGHETRSFERRITVALLTYLLGLMQIS